MPFQRLLQELLGRTPGARGAIFCDYEGEFVELVVCQPQPDGEGPLTDYDLKIIGAQVAAAWATLRENARERGAGGLLELGLRCASGTLLCRALPEGYYVVLLLARLRASAAAGFELAQTAEVLARELL